MLSTLHALYSENQKRLTVLIFKTAYDNLGTGICAHSVSGVMAHIVYGAGLQAQGKILLARLREAHPSEGCGQCLRVHLAASTLEVIVLPSLGVGRLQSIKETLKPVPC